MGNSTLLDANVLFFMRNSIWKKYFRRADARFLITLHSTESVYASTLCRFAPVLTRHAYAISDNALYASTLCARTILPRKARREPTTALEYEASLLAYAYETPPLAYA